MAVARVRPLLLMLAGAVAAFVVLPLVMRDNSIDVEARRPRARAQSHPIPNLACDCPLADGRRIDVETAKTATPYRVAVPPTNDVTGPRTGIWIDPTGQVAFSWKSGLNFYVDRLHDTTPADAHQTWAQKAASGNGTLVFVRGVPGIAHDGHDGNPAALTFIEDGLSIQFVGRSQTVEQLVGLAEQLTYE